ncbi:MAG: hypothetical protein IPO86_00775 [Saprospiraceae bacterium]|nr:hypothetical protein [Saprospiraceae bacterium]
METQNILNYTSRGRTDSVFELMKTPNWKITLQQGQIKPLQWLVYFNDTTGLKAVLENDGDITSLFLDEEFFIFVQQKSII